MPRERKVAFAALDIGTSQIKLGVYCPFLSDRITLINSLSNELIYGSPGEVRSAYTPVREKSFQLFTELGNFLKLHSVDQLYIGICGHVSSLVEWNKIDASPVEESFPIWLDASSHDYLEEYRQVMGNGRSMEIIGTFLPAGTNWLFTKLLQRRAKNYSDKCIFLQVGDAIFFELTGEYKTHFSSQISMVNLRQRTYAVELLQHLQLPEAALPELSYDPHTALQERMKQFGWPANTVVCPAMADLYTSLYGLRLQDHEGFMLANTSEQAGAYYADNPPAVENFLSINFEAGFVNYGSTNTGGNVLNWLLSNILHKEINANELNYLTIAASRIKPEHTPIILPYLQGERAPLWNSKLTASILELQSFHSDVHLFRAVLEAIAFARRQCFEQLGVEDLKLVKIAGGSSKNPLWNAIRASVLNKTIAVADEKELSMVGIIDYMIGYRETSTQRPEIKFETVSPDSNLVDAYRSKYARFLKYQELISDSLI